MTYHNALGQPIATVTICRIEPIFAGEVPYYVADSLGDYPCRKWDGDTAVEDIVGDMERDGFDCEVVYNSRKEPVICCTHRETKAIIDATAAAMTAKFADAVPGYVRYGSVPANGKSKNHRDNRLEKGVSCFAADFAADGSYRLRLTPVLEVSYLTVSNRQAYRLYGDVIGTGADGEPLLRVDRAEKI